MEPSARRTTLLLLGGALALRAALFPFEKNVGGDAIARTWLAFDWAAHPHLPVAFTDGVRQFGPLHIVLMGWLATIWRDAPAAGRALSLVVGVASIVPLMALARRFFSERAAVVAACVFSVWGLHVQCSTTAASEALCCFLVLSALALLESGAATRRLLPLALAGIAATLACATRYDVWLWAPFFVVRVALATRSVRLTLLFATIAAAFPVLWMVGNARATGDPLYPIHDIEAFHRAWHVTETAYWGAARMRGLTLVFWPALAALSLSPLVALTGTIGAALAVRRRHPSWWLVALPVGTLAFYTGRALFAASFVPLARFAVNDLALLCLFVEPGAAWLAPRLKVAPARACAAVVASAALWMAALGAYTTLSPQRFADSLVPISPCSRHLHRLEAAIDAVQRTTRGGSGILVVDSDPDGYDELALAFESGLPHAQIASFRDASFEASLARGPARWLVRFDGGPLPLKDLPDGRIEFRGQRFVAAAEKSGAIRIYRRDPE
jgi:hypothetical protein